MIYESFAKQKDFNKAVLSKEYEFLLYGGGIRSGKSLNQIMLLISFCHLIPNSRHAIIRKTLVNVKRTSVKTFQKCVNILGLKEGQHFKFNKSELVVKFPNGSEILFMDADTGKDADLNKLRGLEVDCILLEECTELSQDVFEIAKQRKGQWSREFKEKFKPVILLNCNPSQGWVKDIFYTSFAEGTLEKPFFYQPALPTDNPHNDPEYLESLKSLPEEVYNCYVLGDWGNFSEPNQLIKEEWIRNCIRETPLTSNYMFLGVDVARYGDDRTVLTFFNGLSVMEQKAFRKLGNVEVAQKVADFIHKLNIDPKHVWIDAVGNGGGVVDILHKNNLKINSYLANHKAPFSNFYNFANFKDAGYWFLQKCLKEGLITIPNSKELISELLKIEYEVNDREFKILPKEKFKKKHGFSPDLSDSLVMSLSNFVHKEKSSLI